LQGWLVLSGAQDGVVVVLLDCCFVGIIFTGFWWLMKLHDEHGQKRGGALAKSIGLVLVVFR